MTDTPPEHHRRKRFYDEEPMSHDCDCCGKASWTLDPVEIGARIELWCAECRGADESEYEAATRGR